MIKEARLMRARVKRLTRLYLAGQIIFLPYKGARVKCALCGKRGKSEPLKLCDVDEMLVCRCCFEQQYTLLPEATDSP